MTITEQKAFLRSYTGQAQAPADFAQRWQETAAALHPAVSCAPVAFGNPCGVYERLTVTFDGRSVTARVIRPAADGVHPLLLMYHDLNRGVRGWHHMTRFLALGFGVVAPEAEPFREDWKVQPAQAAFRQRYLDALAVAKAALALPWVDTGRVYTFGEGFGGGLALLAASLLPCSVPLRSAESAAGRFCRPWSARIRRVGCSEFRTALPCRGAAGHLSDGRVRPAQGSGRDLQPPDLP